MDDRETCHVSEKTETDRDILSFSRGDIRQELIDQSPPTRLSRRSKNPESFLAFEGYDAFLTRFKKLLCDRNS